MKTDRPAGFARGSRARDVPANTGIPSSSSSESCPGLILMAFVLAILIKTFLIQAFYIPSESMEPTLEPSATACS